MHKIYFEKRCIVICSQGDEVLSDPNAVIFHPGSRLDIATVVGMFEQTDYIPKVFILSEDTERTYADLCALFRNVDAAGGLVQNRRSDFLLIKRNGLWDLPKGHREAGEDIALTAMREVEEETGVDELELEELVCITDHCYLRDGVWHLKHTWWYKMLYTKPVELIPQREEDISKAVWVAKSSLPPFLKNTYPSILEVFREAKV